MATDVSIEDPFLIVIRIPPGGLAEWRGLGWTCVESYFEEREARDRFHVIRPAVEASRASAALIRGVPDPERRVVHYTRTIMSKDAEFWTLQKAEIRMAGREEEALWHRSVARLLAELAARDGAPKARKPQPKPPLVPVRVQAAGLFALGAAAVLATYVALPQASDRPSATFSTVKRNGTTILVPDPRDPSALIEYELRDDGTRIAIGKVARGEPRSTESTGESGKSRTLVEGINMFLRVRQ